MPTFNRISVLAALAISALVLSTGTARADIFISMYDDSSVDRFDEMTLAPVAGNIPGGANGLFVAQGVAVSTDSIYVSSGFSVKVQRYDLAGNFIGDFPSVESPAPLVSPSTLHFGPNGNLFVGDFGGNQILEFDPSGAYVGVAATFETAPGGFTWAANGDMIVSELFGSIRQIHEGTPTELVPASLGFTPASMLLLDDGDLLIANLFGNNILRWDSTLGDVSVFATIEHPLPSGSEFPEPTFPSNGPVDIIFDRDGTLLVAIAGPDHEHTGQLQRFALDGTFLGIELSGLGGPTALALTPVPEPSTCVLSALGAVGFAWASRRGRAFRRRARRSPGR